MNKQEQLFLKSLLQTNSHIRAHAERQNSKAEQRYSKAIRASAVMLGKLAVEGDFDTILKVEMTLQQQDLEKYSQNTAIHKNVRDGIDDFEKGNVDYQTLMKSPEKYRIKAYVKRDMTKSDKAVPLDSMRKALRSQAARVRNYARNPMANDAERDFHNARVAFIRKAEKLYDTIQRNQLYRAISKRGATNP